MSKSQRLRRPDWNELLSRLSADDRGRLIKVLRRTLRRRLQRQEQLGSDEERLAVRSAAVGEWRRRHMRGASKSEVRRMNYGRIRNDQDYKAIERELVERYRKRHGASASKADMDVDAMGPAKLCKTYRSTGPKRIDAALGQFANTVGRRCYASVDTDEIRSELAEGLLAVLGREDLGRFTLGDASTEDEVIGRIRSARLLDRAAHILCGKATVIAAASHLLARNLGDNVDFAALTDLMDALLDVERPLGTVVQRLVRDDARDIEAYVLGDEFAHLAAQSLLENPIFSTQFARMREIKQRVRENVPSTPMEAYPLARTMRRHFVLHVGPTNSGKTHDALQALMAAESGVYLGPLRLLAYEQFERMNTEGCPCSLLTGEERQDVACARHVSSTVEMADFHKTVRVAVIDEAQMLADPARGMHWTAAILGIPADEVHVCCAPHAERVVRELVALCEDECEVIRHERLVPLVADRRGFTLPESVEPGDALIVFSRRSVHAVAADVSAAGLRPSLVYGALPHEVRHEEARRFDAGETDVVVATDAIGMGMNLPIRRVVFVEQQKFDGRELRRLRAEEVQQIAGRAGRFGRYDEGLFQSIRWRAEMRRLFAQPVDDIEQIMVGIPEDIALVRDATLSEAIRQWCTIEHPQPFCRMGVRRELELVDEAQSWLERERRTEREAKLAVLALATMPFDEDDRTLRKVWRQMVAAELAGEPYEMELPAEPDQYRTLAELEADYRMCDLLYSYARTFGHPENEELLMQRRSAISHAIMDLLAAASS